MTSDEKPSLYYELMRIAENKGYTIKEFTEIYWEDDKGNRIYVYKKEDEDNGKTNEAG